MACLENEGVTHVFGIPGEENIHLVDAISRSSIRYVLTRHEQGASFMAEVYGRLTGRAGVCSATLGPGAINLLLGTADATTNSTPLVALSAQVGMNRSFKESHQGVDLVSMFRRRSSGRRWSRRPARYLRCSGRRSSWPRPSGPERSTWPSPRTWNRPRRRTGRSRCR